MKRIIAIIAALSVAVAAFGQEEARLLRFPATNGTDIVFSYAGDLWTVPVQGGQASRLTSHIGFEAFAKFSPDGKTIAFTGEYDGNREVYLIPAKGGEPERLTYTATNPRDDMGDRMGPNNIVMAWTGDGIYYRNRTEDGFAGKLWKVSPEGGMPEMLPLPEGGWLSWSPDGTQMSYNRVMREFRTWKYYRGGMADDVWIWDPSAKTVKNITNNIAQDIFPMWIGDEIFYASDRDMIMNLFCYNTRTGATTKVTNFKEYDVKFPSTDGKTIVFENGGWIYRFNPANRECKKVPVTLASDAIYGRPERKEISSKLTAASLAPDGSRLIVTARGEVFDVPVGKGVTRNITRSSNSNDRAAAWSPDGKSVVWIGDSTGETELYVYDVAKGSVKQLTSGSDTYIRRVQWAPDSKHIYYTDRKNRFVEVDPVSGSRKTIMENPAGEFYFVAISPDSKWIAYTRDAENEMSIVYLRSLADGKEYAVTDRWYNSGSPTFSTDGKYLIFTSDRDMNPQYSRIEWNYSFTDMSGVYMAMLAKDTPSPLIATDPSVKPSEDKPAAEPAKKDSKKKDSKKKDAKPEDKPKEKPVTKVDPDGIADRIVKLPVKGRNFYCDGKSLWYGGRGGTRVFTFETGEDESCADGMIDVTPGASKALLRKGGDLYAVKIGPKMDAKPKDKIELNLVTTVNYQEEWAQLFDEIWRAFRDGYYLENMHGRDWKAIKEKYAQMLPYARTRLDVNYLIGEMIGELGTGHCYVTPGEYPKPERVDMGLLGATFSKVKGGFRIDHIMEGATYRPELRSPFEEPGLGVKEGDVITAIDGISLDDVDNIYKLLVGKAGILTELTIGGKKVVVKPIADEGPLEHFAWVQNNVRTVEKLSGGKVGYIYIPDMGPEGLSEWARYYYPQLDKEALIIDDRANGGGNISPMIIERLLRKAYRLTMYRGSNQTGTVPEGTHTGPKVLLINKYSASDGDLFPWSFKANNLGTVIGTRTWGGIVGISGPLPYVDGTDVRVPFFTNYDAKTGQWIVENHGVDPDILLDNDPVKEFEGTDEQLELAVQVALEQLKDRKPLPGVPAPRTFKDLGLPEDF